MLTETVMLPTSFVAVTLYWVRLIVSVGVPLKTPVDASKNKPADGSGVIDQPVIAPPVDSGTMFRTLSFKSRTSSEGTYATIGTWSRTVISISVVLVPPVLVAVTV